MTQVPLDDESLKDLFKTALREVLEERKDILRDLIEETLEDIALARAIEQGQRTDEVSRSEVFSLVWNHRRATDSQGRFMNRPYLDTETLARLSRP